MRYCEKHSVGLVGDVECDECVYDERNALRARVAELETAKTPRLKDEWHEGIGPVLWWALPVAEPPFSGTPMDSDWPDYHTHWTPIIIPNHDRSR